MEMSWSCARRAEKGEKDESSAKKKKTVLGAGSENCGKRPRKKKMPKNYKVENLSFAVALLLLLEGDGELSV